MYLLLLPIKKLQNRITKQGISLFVISLLLTACGGGGGGSGRDTNGSTAPNSSGTSSSIAAIDPLTLSFSTYFNVSQQVTMPYPSNWEAPVVNNDPAILVTYAPRDSGVGATYPPNISLVKINKTDAASSSNDLKNIKIISSRDFTLSGLSSHEEIYDATVIGYDDLSLRFMETEIELNGTIYGLIFTAQRKDFDQYIEIARHIAKGLNIGQKIFSNVSGNSDFRSPNKPAIASDGKDFLVVSCNTSLSSAFATARIIKSDHSMGAEFPISPAQENITSSSCRYSHFTLTYDGTNYLLTYTANKYEVINQFQTNFSSRIFTQRISTSGEVLDETPIDVSQNFDGIADQPAAVSDGHRTLVVWHYSNTLGGVIHDIRGAFVNSDGTVGNSFVVEKDLQKTFTDVNIYLYTPEVAYGNNRFMVIWSPYFTQDTRQQNTSVYGQLVNQDESLALSKAIQIRSDNGDNPRYPQVASDGQNFVVGWIEGSLATNDIDTGNFSVYARKISNTGEFLNGDAYSTGTLIAAPLNTAPNPWNIGEVPKDFLNLSYHNGQYMFVWTSPAYLPESGVYGVKSNTDLTVISQSSPIAGTRGNALNSFFDPRQPNVGYSNESILVVWPDLPNIEGWYIENKVF